MKLSLLFLALSCVSTATLAATSCDDVKATIAAKLDAKGVAGYSLDAVANDAVGDGKVIGSCDGGTKKIVYARGAAPKKDANPADADKK
jgi:hypothetical protein